MKMSDKMNLREKIITYAQEPVSFFLHKKRDFVHRLLKNRKYLEEQEMHEYQQILRYFEGEFNN